MTSLGFFCIYLDCHGRGLFRAPCHGTRPHAGLRDFKKKKKKKSISSVEGGSSMIGCCLSFGVESFVIGYVIGFVGELLIIDSIRYQMGEGDLFSFL